MEDDEEPLLSVLVVLVDLPAGEKGKGQPEGGDEVHQPLPHHTPAKLGRAEEGVAGHQHQVAQEKSDEDHCVGFYVGCDGIKTLAEILSELQSNLSRVYI